MNFCVSKLNNLLELKNTKNNIPIEALLVPLPILIGAIGQTDDEVIRSKVLFGVTKHIGNRTAGEK